MKDFIIKPEHLNKIELWAATAIYVFVVFFLITAHGGPFQQEFLETRTPYDYYDNYFFPQLIRYTFLYAAFLVLTFKVVPRLVERTALKSCIVWILVIFLVLGFVFGTTDTYLRNFLYANYANDDDAIRIYFTQGYMYALRMILMYSFYTVVKMSSLYLLSNSEAIQSRYRIITRDSLIAFVLWMISFLIVIIANPEEELLMLWAILIPSAILLYCFSFYSLIPAALGKKRAFLHYMGKALLVLIIVALPVALLILLLTINGEAAAGITFFNTAFQLVITAPLSWTLYKKRLEGSEEIIGLKKELGRSNANLDFLRSQINPHFLFNALNTIYGTAIQEKAERTSEGIEKLGDMMRFMLQENLQDKISLAREIEYLENYVSLQRLRTAHNPMLQIETSITQEFKELKIAPMLLIPFVENAFKHGISFREPSPIRISLEVRDKTLNFDVFNSKHEKPENDPEKYKSGIGLPNVRQRLQLLYPKKHELMIRETGKEFFVHLTLQLS